MRYPEKEVIFLGRDNSNDLLLKEAGEPYDLSNVTKIRLDIDDGSYVEETSPSSGSIIWAESETGRKGKIMLQLGDKTIQAGDRIMRLTLFDATNPNGVEWGGQEGIRFYVKAAPA